MPSAPKHKQGVKFDEGKLRFDLVPQEALDGLADVYTRGARKYDDRNWELGLAYGRVYAAIQRHLGAWRRGEDIDPEGQHHLDSAMWGIAALRTYEARNMGKIFDDLRSYHLGQKRIQRKGTKGHRSR